MNRRHALGLLLAVTLPWAVVCGVNALYGCSPATAKDRCNRACAATLGKDRHPGVLPKWLSGSGPRSATGRSIAWFRSLGKRLAPKKASPKTLKDVYRATNVVFYGVLWPALMAGLLGVGLWQTRRIRRLRGGS